MKLIRWQVIKHNCAHNGLLPCCKLPQKTCIMKKFIGLIGDR